MRLNFKKISALATSVLLVGFTAGTAMAANYPAPFVKDGVSNVAIVVGTGEGVSVLDGIQASKINDDLHSKVSGTSGGSDTVVTGGDSFKFEKSSTKFHLGAGIRDVVSVALGDDDLPSLLADGKFIDDDNDEFDYTQKMDIENLTLTLWEDSDYEEDTPTIGFKVTSGTDLLNYTLDFSDEPFFSDLATSSLPILGKEYYILSVGSNNNSLTLLDSATTEVITEGETKTVTVDGTSYEVSVSFIDSSETKLEINGELTNSIAEGQTYKLSDGTYVGVKDILYSSKDTGVSSVDFSLGAGKMVLTDGQSVEVNEDAVNDLVADFTNSSNTNLASLVIKWEADDELFITAEQELEMPVFRAVKFVYSGEIYPAMEEIKVKAGSDTYWVLDDFPLKGSTEDIHILYTNGTHIKGIGKDSDNLLRTANSSILSFDGDTDDFFVASWTDGNDAESYLMRVTSFVLESSTNKSTVQYKKDGEWTDLKTKAEDNDAFSIGNVELNITSINRLEKTATIGNAGNSQVTFNHLYSKEGMKVYLPYDTITNGSTAQGAINWSTGYIQAAGHGYEDFYVYFDGEDKNDNIAAGTQFYIKLDETSTNNEAQVADVVGESVSFIEEGDTDNFISILYDDTSPMFAWDKSGDQYALTITYHGSETYGELFLTAPEVTVTAGSGGTGSTGGTYNGVVVTDSEVSSVATKNLIVVGGSCINSAAAKLVEGAYCGSDWTTNTGVAAGEFLIKGYDTNTLTSGLALLVAGYHKEDTVNAATYLRTQTVDTSKAYKGTSSTSAEMMVESAE